MINPPLKIALISLFPNIERGGQINIHRLLEGLDRDRFTPLVIIPGPGPMVEICKEIGIEVEVLDFETSDDTDSGPRFVAQLRHLLLQKGVQLLYVDWPDHIRPSWLAVQDLEVVILWHAQTSIKSSFDQLYFTMADKVECCSPSVRSRFKGFSPKEKLSVIPNAVDTDRFYPGDGTNLKLDFGLEADAPLLLYIGELERFKGLLELFQALPPVIEQYPNLKLWLAGTGQPEELKILREETHRLALNDHVSWLGYRTDVPDLLRAASVFVIPSHSEGMSLSLLEAMASGCPVLASDIPGNQAVLNKNIGFLFPVKDVEALSAALISILTDADLAHKLAQNARNYILSNHQICHFVDAFSKTMAHLIKKIPPF